MEHPTAEKGFSSLLPTPTASDPTKHSSGGLHRRLVKKERYTKGDRRRLPTPTAHLAKETGSQSEYTRKTPGLITQFVPYQKDSTKRARLNPQFVEWMMGLPPGYTTTD
ncbi:MAG: hypothetical protein VYA01_05565 [Bacteroidota bacterium]|nr:hypothetical protein [Bacteroidota bacterium]